MREWPGRPILLSSAVGALILMGTPAQAQSTPSEFATYRYYWFVGLGPSYPEEDIGLLEDGSGSAAFSVGFGHQIVGVLMGEIEFGVMGSEYDVPSSILKDDPTLSNIWLSYSLLGRFSFGRFEPFIGIGAGQGQTDLEVAGEPFEPSELEIADDRSLVVHYRAGFDLALKPKHRLGLEVRRTDCEADLGDLTEGRAQIGGVSAIASYRYTFGQRKSPTTGTP